MAIAFGRGHEERDPSPDPQVVVDDSRREARGPPPPFERARVGPELPRPFDGGIEVHTDRHGQGVRGFPTRLTLIAQHLGFHEDMHPAPVFAMLSMGDLRLVLSAPGGPNIGGGSALPDGRTPEPGGWNRFAIQVDDLTAMTSQLRQAGVRFRSDIINGVGGRQAIIEDPSGNPVELFEPGQPEARLADP